ncbi:MAG: hypothetical protein JWP91_996 [Fibrobacteres bacterium]|nr:hypothetical protein [Fibrobacterota bacterium]
MVIMGDTLSKGAVTGAQRGLSGRLAGLSLALLMGISAAGLSGCGSTGKKAQQAPGGAQAGNPSVRIDEGGDLASLAKGIKTDEDQLILDILLGYRMLLLANPDAKNLDKNTLNKSRSAYDRLEAILRHGGLKAKENGERVFVVTNEDKLSLQDVILSAAEAGDKAAKEGDWERARIRWKEITQSKVAVNFAMEEAQWGLILSDALQSSLPDSTKKRLKEVNDTYMSDIGHEEVSKQVKALLETVTDVKLQRELKKLANRSWEKDKRAGRVTPQAQQAQAAAAAAGTVPPPSETAKEPAAQAATAPPGPDAAAIAAEADSLASKGKYVAALKSLEKGGPEQSWVKDKKAAIGDRFCEDKRRSAANSFKDFKKAAAEADKRNLLKRTAADLDSCLFYFPELPVSQKVRKNREMVEGELKKLKP